MYFLSFDTTIRMSRSTMSLRCTPSALAVNPAVADGDSATTRRAGAAGAAGDGAGVASLGCDAVAEVGGGVPTKVSGLPGLELTDAGRGAGVGRAGSAGSLACSRSQASLDGAILSSAHASRWRRVATWLSQQGTEQNTRRIRARLQVETLH